MGRSPEHAPPAHSRPQRSSAAAQRSTVVLTRDSVMFGHPPTASRNAPGLRSPPPLSSCCAAAAGATTRSARRSTLSLSAAIPLSRDYSYALTQARFARLPRMVVTRPCAANWRAETNDLYTMLRLLNSSKRRLLVKPGGQLCRETKISACCFTSRLLAKLFHTSSARLPIASVG